MFLGMKYAALFFLSLAPLGRAGSPEYFAPSHRVSGIGVARDDLSRDLIEARSDLMIQSQTFGIMRDAMCVPGARRITIADAGHTMYRTHADVFNDALLTFMAEH